MEIDFNGIWVFFDGLFAFAFVTFEEVVCLPTSVLSNQLLISSYAVPMHIDLAIAAINHQIEA
jgi:hypothetical protein